MAEVAGGGGAGDDRPAEGLKKLMDQEEPDGQQDEAAGGEGIAGAEAAPGERDQTRGRGEAEDRGGQRQSREVGAVDAGDGAGDEAELSREATGRGADVESEDAGEH